MTLLQDLYELDIGKSITIPPDKYFPGIHGLHKRRRFKDRRYVARKVRITREYIVTRIQ